MGKIGIFIKNHESIFTNGCVQQGYFVMKALRLAGYNVNYITVDKDYDQFELLDEKIDYVLNYSKLSEYDMVIFSSLTVTQEHFLMYLKFLGIKVVNQMVGNYYLLNAEEFVFGKHKGVINNMINDYVDEIWLMPMYANCIQYIEYMTNKPVKISPYVWDNEFISNYIISENITPRYITHDNYSQPLDIVIMEPNLSVHKNSLVPLLICNRFYMQHPERLGVIYLVSKPSANDSWEESIKHMDIVKNNKITSYPRMVSIEIFQALNQKKSKYVVLSHNIRNGLNFLHLECMTLDIPIIHTCEPFSDNELYYADNDIIVDMNKAVEHLNNVWDKPYLTTPKTTAILDKYSPVNSINVLEYQRLTKELLMKNKSKINDFMSLEVYSRDTISLNVFKANVGILTYIDNTSNLDVFVKGLSLLSSNITVSLPLLVYYNSNFDISTYRQYQFSNLQIEFIQYSDDIKHVDIYLLSISPFETTVYYKNNTILCFNFMELIDKISGDLIIGTNTRCSTTPTNECYKMNRDLLNAFISVYNPLCYNVCYIDPNFIIYRSTHYNNICKNVYKNIEALTTLLDDNLLINLINHISKINITDLKTDKKLVGHIDNNKYSNYGYLHVFKNILVFIVLDEKNKTDFNTAASSDNIKTFNTNKIINRTFDNIKAGNFSL